LFASCDVRIRTKPASAAMQQQKITHIDPTPTLQSNCFYSHLRRRHRCTPSSACNCSEQKSCQSVSQKNSIAHIAAQSYWFR
jgi:hypothetical protein